MVEALCREDTPGEDDLVAGPDEFFAEILIESAPWADLAPLDVVDRLLHSMVASGVVRGPASMEIVFTDDDAIKELNRTFRGKDAPTNVLAFPSPTPPLPGEPTALGSVILADGVMAREAGERGIPLSDHLTHLTLHGVLHLLGHDHENEADRLAMERVEIELLAGLGIPDPYLGS